MGILPSVCQDSKVGVRGLGGVEDKLVPIMRVFLALSAQIAVLTHLPQSIYKPTAFITLNGIYALYGIWVYMRARRGGHVAASLKNRDYWIDVVWCLTLVFLSGGAASLFFIGFLFPIIGASFRSGFVSGLRVTTVSVLSFGVVCAIPLPNLRAGFDLDLLWVRSAWLVGLGFLMAHWGESELTLWRRMKLINEIVGYSNPRFGIDRTVAFILERLRSFYGARSGLIVLDDADHRQFRLLRTGANDAADTADFTPLAPKLASRLLEVPSEYAAVYNARSEGWLHVGRSDRLMEISSGGITKVERSKLTSLAAILDAKSFVTVPVRYRGEGAGRVFVVADNRVFVPSDMGFLLQVLGHVNPIIENIRLVEHLAFHAADEERRRIARDIHDSVIQPYLGLQMGLVAIRKEAGERFPQLSRRIEQLIELAGTGIKDLRGYVSGLKQDGPGNGDLLPAMRRFAARFSEATGIAVEIESDGDVHANARLAAEAFQMMTEGLSNIRRHTQALHAKVRVACGSGHLIMEIANESPGGEPAHCFVPASIAERTEALGGNVRVTSLPDGDCSVTVDIPL